MCLEPLLALLTVNESHFSVSFFLVKFNFSMIDIDNCDIRGTFFIHVCCWHLLHPCVLLTPSSPYVLLAPSSSMFRTPFSVPALPSTLPHVCMYPAVSSLTCLVYMHLSTLPHVCMYPAVSSSPVYAFIYPPSRVYVSCCFSLICFFVLINCVSLL